MDVSNDGNTAQDRIFGNLFASIDILDGLTFRTDFGYNMNNEFATSYSPEYVHSAFIFRNYNSAGNRSRKNTMWQWENTLMYSRIFGGHMGIFPHAP